MVTWVQCHACNACIMIFYLAGPEVKANSSVPEGSIRLVGGSAPNEGVVQIYLFGYWSTVCSNGWDLRGASVACQQLGYPSALAIPSSSSFGRYYGRPWFRIVYCTGLEANLTECRHYTSDRYCGGHSPGVICSSECMHVCTHPVSIKCSYTLSSSLYHYEIIILDAYTWKCYKLSNLP